MLYCGVQHRIPQPPCMISSPDKPVLTVNGLSRRYGHRPVVNNVSLSVAGGEALLLIGHNGAGKTTLLRLLAGLLRPTAGTVTLTGNRAMVAHHSMLYEALTARENLRFFARLHGSDAEHRIDEQLERIGLERAADQRVAAFSRGMVQRLTIARALLAEPDILLLDEPLTGLDEAASTFVFGVLKDFRASGKIVVAATHQLANLVELSSSVGYLVGGSLVALEPIERQTPADISARYRELAQHG